MHSLQPLRIQTRSVFSLTVSAERAANTRSATSQFSGNGEDKDRTCMVEKIALWSAHDGDSSPPLSPLLPGPAQRRSRW